MLESYSQYFFCFFFIYVYTFLLRVTKPMHFHGRKKTHETIRRSLSRHTLCAHQWHPSKEAKVIRKCKIAPTLSHNKHTNSHFLHELSLVFTQINQFAREWWEIISERYPQTLKTQVIHFDKSVSHMGITTVLYSHSFQSVELHSQQ